MTLTNLRNLLIGFTSDSGERLQVNGTAKITGASSFGDNVTISKNYDGETKLTISNTTSGGSSIAYISFVSSNGLLNIGKRSSTQGVYKILAVNDSQIFNNTAGDIAILNDWASGNIKFAAGGSATAQLTLNASGNLGLGVTPSAWGTSMRVMQYQHFGSLATSLDGSRGVTILSNNAFFNGISWIYLSNAFAGNYNYNSNNGSHFWRIAPSGTAGNAISFTQAMTLTSAGRLILGAGDSGELLQVNGTAKITGAATFSSSVTAASFVNTTQNAFLLNNSGVNNDFRLGSATSVFRIVNFANTVGLFSITDTGEATFSSSVTATQLTTTRATTSTNNYLQFTTGGTTNWQIGTPSSLTALSFLDGGVETFRLDTGGIVSLGGNFGIGGATFGTSATRTLAITSGTAPTTSPADRFQMYSNDVVAGNAAPHFRTENGAVIKLYQETTAVGNSTISIGGGSAVLDDTEFGGYTLRQVVKALQNQGILA
jgi:hypothetical protein